MVSYILYHTPPFSKILQAIYSITRRNWPFTDKVFRCCPISKSLAYTELDNSLLAKAKLSIGLTGSSAYRKPAFQPSAFRRLFIGFQPSAENQPPWKKFKYGINYMNWWWNFSISLKKFEKKFFAWNVLKHKVKPKNARKSTLFTELKISPLFLKNTCKIFKSKMFALVCCNFS